MSSHGLSWCIKTITKAESFDFKKDGKGTGWMQWKREHIAAGEAYTLWSTGAVIKKDLRRQIGNFYLERDSLMKRQSGSEQGRGLDRWREKQGNQWEKSEEETKTGKVRNKEKNMQQEELCTPAKSVQFLICSNVLDENWKITEERTRYTFTSRFFFLWISLKIICAFNE